MINLHLIIIISSVVALGVLIISIISWDNDILNSIQALLQTPTAQPPGLIDTDGDGLPNWVEIRIGTDPFNRDTDRDGLSDRDELRWRTSPLDPDTDGDGDPDKMDPGPGPPTPRPTITLDANERLEILVMALK